ncbi:hypothetical protein [Lacinutrix sp. Bg11-31]|uniref:hypothetical protein n=1 Tax=Lacinutrix sp. Bg11-31 TaxID=2057808 RepID=UPI000C3156CD|nr:hypothetical protein [Lacinutrix sp. Bg11-31]AUC82555.1 hypothetical protein CW733_10635 [Lacinutrix sp. Bg11-31]
MNKIKLIEGRIIQVINGEKVSVFKVELPFLTEIKMWPSGIEVDVIKIKGKYKITPYGWGGNFIYTEKVG